MRDMVDRVVGPFLSQVDAALDSGYSVVLYGSAARGDFVPGRSDLDLILVTDDLSPARLSRLGEGEERWILETKAVRDRNRVADALAASIAIIEDSLQRL